MFHPSIMVSWCVISHLSFVTVLFRTFFFSIQASKCPLLVSRVGVRKQGWMDSCAFPPFVPVDLVVFLSCHILRSAATWAPVPVSFSVSALRSFCRSHSWVGGRVSAARIARTALACIGASVKSDSKHFLNVFFLLSTNHFIPPFCTFLLPLCFVCTFSNEHYKYTDTKRQKLKNSSELFVRLRNRRRYALYLSWALWGKAPLCSHCHQFSSPLYLVGVFC